jgi:hypothetical protein
MERREHDRAFSIRQRDHHVMLTNNRSALRVIDPEDVAAAAMNGERRKWHGLQQESNLLNHGFNLPSAPASGNGDRNPGFPCVL